MLMIRNDGKCSSFSLGLIFLFFFQLISHRSIEALQINRDNYDSGLTWACLTSHGLLKVGNKAEVIGCRRLTCAKGKSVTFIQEEICSPIPSNIPIYCAVRIKQSEPYPNCCPSIVCTNPTYSEQVVDHSSPKPRNFLLAASYKDKATQNAPTDLLTSETSIFESVKVNVGNHPKHVLSEPLQILIENGHTNDEPFSNSPTLKKSPSSGCTTKKITTLNNGPESSINQISITHPPTKRSFEENTIFRPYSYSHIFPSDHYQPKFTHHSDKIIKSIRAGRNFAKVLQPEKSSDNFRKIRKRYINSHSLVRVKRKEKKRGKPVFFIPWRKKLENLRTVSSTENSTQVSLDFNTNHSNLYSDPTTFAPCPSGHQIHYANETSSGERYPLPEIELTKAKATKTNSSEIVAPSAVKPSSTIASEIKHKNLTNIANHFDENLEKKQRRTLLELLQRERKQNQRTPTSTTIRTHRIISRINAANETVLREPKSNEKLNQESRTSEVTESLKPGETIPIITGKSETDATMKPLSIPNLLKHRMRLIKQLKEKLKIARNDTKISKKESNFPEIMENTETSTQKETHLLPNFETDVPETDLMKVLSYEPMKKSMPTENVIILDQSSFITNITNKSGPSKKELEQGKKYADKIVIKVKNLNKENATEDVDKFRKSSVPVLREKESIQPPKKENLRPILYIKSKSQPPLFLRPKSIIIPSHQKETHNLIHSAPLPQITPTSIPLTSPSPLPPLIYSEVPLNSHTPQPISLPPSTLLLPPPHRPPKQYHPPIPTPVPYVPHSETHEASLPTPVKDYEEPEEDSDYEYHLEHDPNLTNFDYPYPNLDTYVEHIQPPKIHESEEIINVGPDEDMPIRVKTTTFHTKKSIVRTSNMKNRSTMFKPEKSNESESVKKVIE